MTNLCERQQERVAQALFREFGPTLNVSMETVKKQVSAGLWDDHPTGKLQLPRKLQTVR